MLEKLLTIPAEFWGVLSQMAPYLLFGFLAAGLLSVLVPPRTVERHLGGGGFWPVVKAAAFGVPLPLCSCGVIPVAASMRRHGASRGATVAFLISTPQTGVDSIFVTFSLLGLTFAIFRPIVALISGVIGGAAAAAFTRDEASRQGQDRQACEADCCAPDRGGKLRRALAYGFGALPQDIGAALLVGLVVAALVTALVPRGFFGPVLGGGVPAMVLMMLLGIPVYVCATASVPLAVAMIAAGVSPGAALVFLMTGPATNAATVMTVWKVLGRRTAVLYLATVGLSALAAGLTLDYIFRVQGGGPGEGRHWMLPKAVEWACAVLLLGVLAVGAIRSRRGARPRAEQPAAAQEEAAQDESKAATELRITGMTCTHCRQAVQRALAECDGAETAVVDLAAGRARVTGRADPAALRKAVEDLGYGAEEILRP
jgi:hypothetical protein